MHMVDHSCSMFHIVNAVQLYITCVHQNHATLDGHGWSFMFHDAHCQGSTVVHHMCTSEPCNPWMHMVDHSCSMMHSVKAVQLYITCVHQNHATSGWTWLIIPVPCFTLSTRYSCTSHVYIRTMQPWMDMVDHSCSMMHIVKAVQLYITCVHQNHAHPRWTWLIIRVPWCTLSTQYICTSHVHIIHVPWCTLSTQYICTSHVYIRTIHTLDGHGWSFMFHDAHCQGSTVVHHMWTSEPCTP
jgi:hypothetical protein